MPIYEYRCKKCGEVSEFLVLRDNDPVTCKKCGGVNLGKLMCRQFADDFPKQ